MRKAIMSETKHTPGPWNCEGAEILVRIGIDPLHLIVPIHARGYRIGYWISLEWSGMCPDAQLAAAAPDLLAALRILHDHASETYPHFESERGVRDLATAQAAITAATGGA